MQHAPLPLRPRAAVEWCSFAGARSAWSNLASWDNDAPERAVAQRPASHRDGLRRHRLASVDELHLLPRRGGAVDRGGERLRPDGGRAAISMARKCDVGRVGYGRPLVHRHIDGEEYAAAGERAGRPGGAGRAAGTPVHDLRRARTVVHDGNGPPTRGVSK